MKVVIYWSLIITLYRCYAIKLLNKLKHDRIYESFNFMINNMFNLYKNEPIDHHTAFFYKCASLTLNEIR